MHNREKTWRTADGRSVPVKEMTLGHLVNVVNWILDNPRSYPASALELMIAEARYRQTVLFAEGKSYPQLVSDRWKIIDPQTGIGKIEKPPADYIEAVKDNPAYTAMFKQTQAKRKAKNGTV
jgi:hypothetical protein